MQGQVLTNFAWEIILQIGEDVSRSLYVIYFLVVIYCFFLTKLKRMRLDLEFAFQ